MISVEYDRNVPMVIVKGHAGTAPKGEDLVCAAASILVYALAGLEKLEQLGEHKARINSGYSMVRTEPLPGLWPNVVTAYDAVCNGFAILQKQYPEAVKYEVRGV